MSFDLQVLKLRGDVPGTTVELPFYRIGPKDAPEKVYLQAALHADDAIWRGAHFHLVRGVGFRYERYRDEVLEAVRSRWYAVPAWLPAGPCYFCDRYFPDRACHR